MGCPVKSSTEWKLLSKQSRGEEFAWRPWVVYNGNVPIKSASEIKSGIKWGSDMDITSFNKLHARAIKYNNQNNTGHKVTRVNHPNNPFRYNAELVIDYVPMANDKLQALLDKTYPDEHVSVNDLGKKITELQNEDTAIDPPQQSLFIRGVAKQNTPVTNWSKGLSYTLGVKHSWVTAAKAYEMTDGKWSGEPGFSLNGNVYYVDKFVSAETQIHEFGHPLINALEQHNAPLHKKLFNDFLTTEQGLEIYKDVLNLYPEHFENGVPDSIAKNEMLTRSLAKEAENKVAKKTTTLSVFVDKLLKAINSVLHALGKPKIDVKKLSVNTTIGELAEMMTGHSKMELHLDQLAHKDDPEFMRFLPNPFGNNTAERVENEADEHVRDKLEELKDDMVARKAVNIANEDLIKNTPLMEAALGRPLTQVEIDQYVQSRIQQLSTVIGRDLANIKYNDVGLLFDHDKPQFDPTDPESGALDYWQWQYYLSLETQPKFGHVEKSKAALGHKDLLEFGDYVEITTKHDIDYWIDLDPGNHRRFLVKYEKYKQAHKIMLQIMQKFPTKDALMKMDMNELNRWITRLKAKGVGDTNFVLKKLDKIYFTRFVKNRIQLENQPTGHTPGSLEDMRAMRERGLFMTNFFYDHYKQAVMNDASYSDTSKGTGMVTSYIFFKENGVQLVNSLIEEARNKQVSILSKAKRRALELNKNVKDLGRNLNEFAVKVPDEDGKISEYFAHDKLPHFNLAELSADKMVWENIINDPNTSARQRDNAVKMLANVEHRIEKRKFFDKAVAMAKTVPKVTVQGMTGKNETYYLFSKIPVEDLQDSVRDYQDSINEINENLKDTTLPAGTIAGYQVELMTYETLLNKTKAQLARYEIAQKQQQDLIKKIKENKKSNPQEYEALGMLAINMYVMTHIKTVTDINMGGLHALDLAAYAVPQTTADPIEIKKEHGVEHIAYAETEEEAYLDDIMINTGSGINKSAERYGSLKIRVLNEMKKGKFSAFLYSQRMKIYRRKAQQILERANKSPEKHVLDDGNNVVFALKATPPVGAKFTHSKYRSKDINSMVINYYQGLFMKNALKDSMPVFDAVGELYKNKGWKSTEYFIKFLLDHRVYGHKAETNLGEKLVVSLQTMSTIVLWSRLGFNVAAMLPNHIDANFKFHYQYGLAGIPRLLKKATMDVAMEGNLTPAQNLKRMHRVLMNLEIINTKEHIAASVERKTLSNIQAGVFMTTSVVEYFNQIPFMMMRIGPKVYNDYNIYGELLPGKKGISIGKIMQTNVDVYRSSGPYAPATKAPYQYWVEGRITGMLGHWKQSMINMFVGPEKRIGNVLYSDIIKTDLILGYETMVKIKNGQIKSVADITPIQQEAMRKTTYMVLGGFALTLALASLYDDDDEKERSTLYKALQSLLQFFDTSDRAWYHIIPGGAIIDYILDISEFITQVFKQETYDRNTNNGVQGEKKVWNEFIDLLPAQRFIHGIKNYIQEDTKEKIRLEEKNKTNASSENFKEFQIPDMDPTKTSPLIPEGVGEQP